MTWLRSIYLKYHRQIKESMPSNQTDKAFSVQMIYQIHTRLQVELSFKWLCNTSPFTFISPRVACTQSIPPCRASFGSNSYMALLAPSDTHFHFTSYIQQSVCIQFLYSLICVVSVFIRIILLKCHQFRIHVLFTYDVIYNQNKVRSTETYRENARSFMWL